MRWALAFAVLAAALAAACSDNALEQRVAALEADRSVRAVIAKHVEEPRGDLLLAGAPADRFMALCAEVSDGISDGFGCPWRGRSILTVAFAGTIREIYVGISCYLVVRVGDPWPSEHEECR